MTAASMAMALATIPFARPAMAQGTTAPVFRDNTSCPTGWRNSYAGEDIKLCYPRGTSNTKPIYLNRNKKPCASGYGQEGAWCVEGVKSKTAASDKQDSSSSSASSGSSFEGSAADRLVSYGTVTKANKLDRCPLGYFSKSDMTTCTTRLSPAPKSRNKTGVCNSNEIDEWGLYCTADANVITRAQAEQEATRDFNAIYSANGANYPAQGSDTEDYPSMVAAYGPKGGGSSSAASATGSGAAQTAQASGCANGSATGAAIGGAMAGEGGAALGSMLGGLGKKKKNKGC
ncbi:hypothetical protein [Blastomonas sp. SL216]|uniref:hypothetical protein n=1 Tax=Blastomonas sp. SL216 TaxID=2995169 RepID=UPI002376F770|nr:hypothetical protein OU999_11385 [Blastomonas sp. SL216]